MKSQTALHQADAEAPITRAYDMDGVLTSAGPMSITPNADTGLPTTSNVGALTSTYGYNGFGEMDSAGHSWMGTSISGNLSYTRKPCDLPLGTKRHD